MKYLSSFCTLLFFLLITGCEDPGTTIQGPTDGNTKYPTKLNNEWEYRTTIKISYYNQSGGFDSTASMYSDDYIIKVIKTNDSLKNYKNLIEFKLYDKLEPGNASYDWYLNSDTSFLAIAYYNPGGQVIQPKRNYSNRYLTLDELKRIIFPISPNLTRLSNTVHDDTIQYYAIPRKILLYPLAIGNSWIELYQPFYRERYVNNYLTVNLDGQPYNCYEIKVNWPNYKTEFNDYVSLSAGLVKREIISDSILITTSENPDSGFFAKVYTVSKLIRKNS